MNTTEAIQSTVHAAIRARRRQNKELLDAGLVIRPHGDLYTYTEFMCRCDLCKTAMSEYQRGHRDSEQETHRTTEWYHQTPPGSGENNGKVWDQEEVRTATEMREDGRYVLSAPEVAEKLGRTIRAVQAMRARKSIQKGVANIRRNLL